MRMRPAVVRSSSACSRRAWAAIAWSSDFASTGFLADFFAVAGFFDGLVERFESVEALVVLYDAKTMADCKHKNGPTSGKRNFAKKMRSLWHRWFRSAE